MARRYFYSVDDAARMVGMASHPEWSTFLDFCRRADFGALAVSKPGGGTTWLVPEPIVQEIVQETARAREACLEAILQRIAGQEVRHGR